MAALAVAEKKMLDALQFAGEADGMRASIGAQQLAWMRPLAEARVAEARRHVTRTEADDAYRRGLEMTIADAVGHAVSYLSSDQVAPEGPRPQLISRRELEVARLVSEGLTNRDIAKALFISERTVDNHVKHVLDKLHFRSRSQIGAWLAESLSPWK
jgi:non-specific serine/threonine protein kinase